MSRYQLPVEAHKDPGVDHIVVGWDRPLRTFFVQVFAPSSGEEDPKVILHEGWELDRPVSMESLKRFIAPFAELPPDIEAAMKKDQGATISQVDSPHLAGMKGLLRGLRDARES